MTDFHSAEAAKKAGEDWAKQFQKDEVPESLMQVAVSVSKVRIADVMPNSEEGGAAQNIDSDASDSGAFFIRADKLIKEAGLTGSTSEAGRKIKEKAVEISGQILSGLVIVVPANRPLTVRVGRRIKSVVLTLP